MSLEFLEGFLTFFVDVVVGTFSETVEVSTVSSLLCALRVSSKLLVSLEFLEGFLTFFVTSLNFVARAVIPIVWLTSDFCFCASFGEREVGG